MDIRVYMQCGVVKAKSHLSATPSAGRKYFAGYRCDLMREGVIVAVKLIVSHIVNAGDGTLSLGLYSSLIFETGEPLTARRGLSSAKSCPAVTTAVAATAALQKLRRLVTVRFS